MLTKGAQLTYVPPVPGIPDQPAYTVCDPDPTAPPPSTGGSKIVCEYVNVLVGYWTAEEVALQPGHRVGEPKYVTMGPYCRTVST